MSRDPLSRSRRFWLVPTAVGVAAAMLYRGELIGQTMLPFQVLTARGTQALLRALGFESMRLGAVLYHSGGFGYEISHGCTGVVPAAMLAAGIAAYEAPLRKKISGVLVGVPMVLLVNLLRLANLYIVGVRWPRWFDVAHERVWESVVILSVLGLWLVWAAWVDRDYAVFSNQGPDRLFGREPRVTHWGSWHQATSQRPRGNY